MWRRVLLSSSSSAGNGRSKVRCLLSFRLERCFNSLSTSSPAAFSSFGNEDEENEVFQQSPNNHITGGKVTNHWSQNDRNAGSSGMYQQGFSSHNDAGGSVAYEQSKSSSFTDSRATFQQSPNQSYSGSTSTQQQSPRNSYNGRINMYQQSPDNYYTGNSDAYQPRSDDFNTGTSGTNQQGSYNFNVGAPAYQQSPNNLGMGTSSIPQQNFNDYHPGTATPNQHSPSNSYMGSMNMYQQSPNEYYTGNKDVYQQGSNCYSTGTTGTNQHSSSNFSLGSNGTYEQSTNNFNSGASSLPQQSSRNYYPGSTGAIQQGSTHYYAGSSGEHRQNQYGFNNGNIGEYPQMINRNAYDSTNSSMGQFQGNLNGAQIVDSGVENNSNPSGDSAAESSQRFSTIEELDDLCKEGKIKEAVEVLSSLEEQGIAIDLPRYLLLMRACGDAMALEEAKFIHEHITKSLSSMKISTYNKILEMYSKCGSMDDAYAVFDKMPHRNLTSWDTMITWFGKNEHGEEAVDIFYQFRKAGLKPDAEMFIGLFSACGVIGDVTEGMLHFESMTKEFGIVPSMKHYVSIVNMLGTSGYLDEAFEFIDKMPLEPNVDVWETMMTLCRIHGNTELGDRCAELVEQMDPSRLSKESKDGLIPLKPSDIEKDKQKNRLSGTNPLEIRSRVHEYRAGDRSHPESDRIYAQLRGLREQMKESGYIPETKVVLHDVDQESKEDALLAHSERLAIGYGLLSSPARQSIRVIKNLRVCVDCHNALKIISKIVGREIVTRDAKRFHHMKDGSCSCRDYW